MQPCRQTLLELEPRDFIEAKHGRALEIFLLNHLKPECSRNQETRQPNEAFAAEYDRLLVGGIFLALVP